MNSSWDWLQICRQLHSTPNRAREILTDAKINLDTLKKYSQQPSTDEPYQRHVFFRSDEFEVLLATWAPGATCAPHDHGPSTGLVWLVAGTFIETQFGFQNSLTQKESCAHPLDGPVLSVDPKDIHQMHTPTGGMSLHFYSPPVDHMRVFDPVTEKTFVVSENCGAWVPADKSLIVEEHSWN
jgi:predicted metal-dependent enzyme (double-stranded beta helix superfamily)